MSRTNPTHRRSRAPLSLPLVACLLTASAAMSTGCVGLDAEVAYPDSSLDVGPSVLTPEGESGPSLSVGEFKIARKACEGIDTHPITQTLTPDDLTRFLEAQGVKFAVKKARGNLYWFEFPTGEEAPNDQVRLRLAVLDSPNAAAEDLHRSLLEHGPGWWGFRRSNLAVLAPRADLEDALQFALERKLACWGVLTVADTDDAYVIPGPYGEP